MEKRWFYTAFLMDFIFFWTLTIGSEPTMVTVRGWIESYDWDNHNEITQVSILVESSKTEENEDFVELLPYEYYVIADDDEGRELASYIGYFAEVKGTVELSDDGTTKFTVESFKTAEDELKLNHDNESEE